MNAKKIATTVNILTILTLFLTPTTNVYASLKLTSPAFVNGDPVPLNTG